jgi:hypothetical protein
MRDLRAGAVPLLASVERAAEVARAAGLSDAMVTRVELPFPDLGPEALVAWRLGMAAVAPFLADLTDTARRQVTADALERLGDPPVLVRRMVVIAAIV